MKSNVEYPMCDRSVAVPLGGNMNDMIRHIYTGLDVNTLNDEVTIDPLPLQDLNIKPTLPRAGTYGRYLR